VKEGDFEGDLLLLRRSAGLLSSGVLAGDGDERGARFLGGRACIARIASIYSSSIYSDGVKVCRGVGGYLLCGLLFLGVGE
jgi:hypothetical protein